MSIKIIQIAVPYDSNINISEFSPEENFLMLKIGSDVLREGRKVITNLTSNEVYKKIENEFKKDFESLDIQFKLEKETSIKMQEKIKQMYESQIEMLNKKLENAMVQLKTYEQDNYSSLQESINKAKYPADSLKNVFSKTTLPPASFTLHKTLCSTIQ
jgi:CTP synthase (UTP-ammonia lyase)